MFVSDSQLKVVNLKPSVRSFVPQDDKLVGRRKCRTLFVDRRSFFVVSCLSVVARRSFLDVSFFVSDTLQ